MEHVGTKNEINWWDNVLGDRNHKKHQGVINRFNPKEWENICPLDIREILLGRLNPNELVIDMGCGPGSVIPFAQHRGKRLIGTDLLVCEYLSLLKKYNLKPNCTMIPAAMEDWNLLSVFRESADVVYSRNALDHSNVPWAGVTNMVHMVAPGGDLFIQVYWREGQRSNYQGMHQNDIWIEGEGDNMKVMCSHQQGEALPFNFEHLTCINANQIEKLYNWVKLHYRWEI